jgi:hypothetical protein
LRIVIDRASFLRLGAVAAAGVLVPTATASAQGLPTPAPQGDDIGFLQFGVLAERVSLDAYRVAAKAKGWTAAEQQLLRTIARAKADHVAQLTAALGADAPAADDYSVKLPAGALGDARKARAFLERLEQLLVGVYVGGAAFSADPATRLLIARLLVSDAQSLSALRGLRGDPVVVTLPNPIDLETAGDQLDTLLQANGYPS